MTCKLRIPVLLMVPLACVLSCSGNGSRSSNSIAIPQAPSGVNHSVSTAPVRVIITWNSSAAADHYRIYRSSTSGFTPSSGTHIGDSPEPSFTDLAVVSGRIYYYAVTTVSASGYEGPPSPEIVVRLAQPMPPLSVVSVAGDGRVTIVWSPVNGASSYSVYRSLNTGITATLSSRIASLVSGTSYQDASPPLTNGQSYFYAVSSVNDFGEGALSCETAAVPMMTSGMGTIIIQGVALYEDREYDATRGLNGNSSLKPVRFADVEVVDAANQSLPALASGATRSNGSYSFAIPASALGKSVFVQVISSATITSGASAHQAVNVMHLDRSLYGSSSPQFTLSRAAQVTIGIPAEGPGGAFNILDVLTAGFEFVNDLDSLLRTFSLNAYWDRGNTIGTWYCIQSGGSVCSPSGEGIYVLGDAGGTGDTDEYDDDVLWHEFGHFAADKRSRDESPGGMHYLNDNDLDLRLTWSEGWGSFFSGAVKYWLNTDAARRQVLSASAGTPLSKYIDTSSSGAHLVIDVASPEQSPYCASSGYKPNPCKYASNEVAVAKVLWNMMAEPTFGMRNIWDVVTDYLPSVTPVNLEAFWDGWLVRMNPGVAELGLVKGIYSDRLIDYSGDIYETDNTMATATTYTVNLSGPQFHTLYPAPDGDLVLFFGNADTQYTVATNNLVNGADTFLTLADAGGAVLATDDNGNGTGITYSSGSNYDYYDAVGNYVYPLNTASNLSSKIIFRPAVSGLYRVNISSSGSRPKTSGRYGSYTLTITSP